MAGATLAPESGHRRVTIQQPAGPTPTPQDHSQSRPSTLMTQVVPMFPQKCQSLAS